MNRPFLVGRRVFLALLLALVIAAGAAAWYFSVVRLDLGSIQGEITGLDGYFAGGTGSEETPYEIATPEQLRNLSWLQYLGYFNETTTNAQEETVYVTVYFRLTSDLDMTGMVIPPIGTNIYPFAGSFDGANRQITNLAVSTAVDSGEDQLHASDLPVAIQEKYDSTVTGLVPDGPHSGLFGVLADSAAVSDLSVTTRTTSVSPSVSP